MSESPFLDSVERRRPGSSMRAYVTRTLPHSSAIVVANRAPHEPRPEGGFTRGAGGVITALLTMAEVTDAEWVACARTQAERELVAQQGPTAAVPLIRGETRLPRRVQPSHAQRERLPKPRPGPRSKPLHAAGTTPSAGVVDSCEHDRSH